MVNNSPILYIIMAAAPQKGAPAAAPASQDKTLEKVEATKNYLDNYYENMQKEMKERRERFVFCSFSPDSSLLFSFPSERLHCKSFCRMVICRPRNMKRSNRN